MWLAPTQSILVGIIRLDSCDGSYLLTAGSCTHDQRHESFSAPYSCVGRRRHESTFVLIYFAGALFDGSGAVAGNWRQGTMGERLDHAITSI
jgi:hypothetical protein